MNFDTIIGMEFPYLEVETLSGKRIVYPDSVKSKVTLIIIAFERQVQGRIDTWFGPFLDKFKNEEQVTYYEIPMIKKRWVVISPIIDGGMKSGLPREKHDHVTTYYGDVDKYSEKLLILDKSDCYIFLLDKEGHIQWVHSGVASDEKLKMLFEKTMELIKR